MSVLQVWKASLSRMRGLVKLVENWLAELVCLVEFRLQHCVSLCTMDMMLAEAEHERFRRLCIVSEKKKLDSCNIYYY